MSEWARAGGVVAMWPRDARPMSGEEIRELAVALPVVCLDPLECSPWELEIAAILLEKVDEAAGLQAGRYAVVRREAARAGSAGAGRLAVLWLETADGG